MEIHKLYIEESKVNKGCFVVVATTLDGGTWVLSGNHDSPTYAIPYDRAWDASTMEEKALKENNHEN